MGKGTEKRCLSKQPEWIHKKAWKGKGDVYHIVFDVSSKPQVPVASPIPYSTKFYKMCESLVCDSCAPDPLIGYASLLVHMLCQSYVLHSALKEPVCLFSYRLIWSTARPVDRLRDVSATFDWLGWAVSAAGLSCVSSSTNLTGVLTDVFAPQTIQFMYAKVFPVEDSTLVTLMNMLFAHICGALAAAHERGMLCWSLGT